MNDASESSKVSARGVWRAAAVTGILMVGLLLAVQPATAQAGFAAFEAFTLDRDGNGHIDTVAVRFINGDIDIDTVDRSKFRLTGPAFTITTITEFGPQMLLLHVEEQQRPRTEQIPTVRITAGAIKSTTGTPVPGINILPPDLNAGEDFTTPGRNQNEASPVLLVAYATPGSTDFVAHFSEPVYRMGTGQILPTDFILQSSFGTIALTQVPNRPHILGDSHVWLRAAQPFSAADLDTGDGVGAFTLSVVESVACGAPGAPKSCVTGINTQGSWEAIRRGPGDISPAQTTVAVPYAIAASADIGSDLVRLYFNGPITASIRAGDLTVIRAEDGEVSGVLQATAPAKATFALVTLDEAVVRSEVDTTPAFLRVRADSGIRADRINTAPAEVDLPLIDVTHPQVTRIITRDIGGTGSVNAFELTFSEPISDSADFSKIHIETLAGKMNCIPLSCRLDTGEVDNDDTVFLIFDAPGLGTAALPRLWMEEGAFRDMAGNSLLSNALLSHPIGSSLINYPDGNPSWNFTPGLVPVEDGAPPRIVDAITLDREGNGYLTHYSLVFSEPIDRNSFNSQHWTVEGYTIGADLVRNEPQNPVTITITRLPDPTAHEPRLGTTGDTPQVLYHPPAGQGLKDLAGNMMLPFGSGGVVERDGAAPVVIGAFGEVGSDVVLFEFSEGVTRLDGSGLTRDNFVYSNIAAGGASGIVSVSHTAGDRIVTLRLNAPLTNSDFTQDRIVPSSQAGNLIVEVGGTKTVNPILTGFRIYVDRFPPGSIQSVEVVADKTTANSITLRWIAPGNDGLEGRPVDGYDVRLAGSPITTQTRFTDATVVENVQFPAGGFVGPGQFQEVTIFGLDPVRQYHFAVKAFDANGNIAANPSPSVSATTLDDVTPPVGTYNVSLVGSTKQAEGRLIQFSWQPFTDPESVVEYRYGISHNPRDDLAGSDASTLSEGVQVLVPWSSQPWVFLMQAQSAGGPLCRDTHPENPCMMHAILIPPHPTDEEFYAAHANVAVSATLKRGTYTVEWQLPDLGQLPGQPIGLSIWRIPAQGNLTLVASMAGDYEFLRTGSYADVTAGSTPDSTYLVAMEFQERPGFPSLSSPPDSNKLPNSSVAEVATVPWWVLLLLGLLGVLLLAGTVAFFVMRKPEQEWMDEMPIDETEYAGDEGGLLAAEAAPGTAAGAAASAQAPAELPEHSVNCPKCSQLFTARGNRPLPIECPHCGVRGVL